MHISIAGWFPCVNTSSDYDASRQPLAFPSWDFYYSSIEGNHTARMGMPHLHKLQESTTNLPFTPPFCTLCPPLITSINCAYLISASSLHDQCPSVGNREPWVLWLRERHTKGAWSTTEDPAWPPHPLYKLAQHLPNDSCQTLQPPHCWLLTGHNANHTKYCSKWTLYKL